MTQQIMVVRHAEKPDANGNERGLDEHGHDDPRGLTVRGWQRAGALVRFFAPVVGQRFTDGLLVTPKAIFAVAPHASSQRPTLTVQLLGQLLGLTVDSRFVSEDVASLIQAAERAEGPVLICWRHNHMAAIAKQLCPWLDPVPEWAAECFDQVWVFTESKGRWAMTRVAQRLLPGDAESVPAAAQTA